MLEHAKKTFEIEGNAILNLRERLNDNFINAVNIILSCEGKVIVTGIGKSGLISQKIASTFACSGTPAFFIHSAEGIHGDIGMISKKDVVIAVSNSGETDELVKILPIIKRLGLKLIALTGNKESVLAKNADILIDVSVKEEACSMGLIPTASTAVTMAMGDALAITVLESRGFSEEDFAVLHPGGALGKKLLLMVEDLMHVSDEIPLVLETDSIKEVLIEITSKRLGVTGVSDNEGNLTGIITDGDLRRALERKQDILSAEAKEVMSTSPKTIEKTALAAKALQEMEQHSITSLFVFSATATEKIEGIIHLHDILKAGVV